MLSFSVLNYEYTLSMIVHSEDFCRHYRTLAEQLDKERRFLRSWPGYL